nr:TIM barrel protein [Bauldia sp.]
MSGRIHLGVAPIAWSNNDMLELGGETSLETCLRETRKAGFTGTETGVKFPMDPAVLGPILKKHKLALVSGWFSGELLNSTVKAEQKRMMAQIDTYKALGAPCYVYAETTGTVQNRMDAPLSSRPRLPEADFPAYGRKLTELAEWMADYGVPMTYHHHMGTIVETQREIDLLMKHTGSAVGLLLDTGHLTFAGGDILETTRKHGRRINHVH